MGTTASPPLSPPGSRPLARALGSVWLFAAAALVLFHVGLGRGLYIDEYTTWEVTSWPMATMLRQRLEAGHLPGYFVLMRGWVTLAGDREAMLRLPSLVLTLAAVLLFRRWAIELTDRRTGILAGWLLLGNSLTVWTAQTARPYAMLLCAVVAAGWCLTHYWRSGRWGWLAGMAASLAIGVLGQAMAVLVLVALLITAIAGVRRRPRRAWTAAGVLLAVLAAMLVPLALLREEQANYEARHFGFPVDKGLNALGHTFFGDYDFWNGPGIIKYLGWLGIALAFWGAWRWMARRRSEGGAAPRDDLPLATLLFAWLGITWVALVIVAGFQTKSTLGQERYFAHTLPVMALLLAMGVRDWRARLAGRGPWLRALPLVLPWVLMVPCTAGWLAERGDGPQLIAPRLAPPAAIAGELMPLKYELRGQDRALISLNHLTTAEAAARLKELAGDHERLWLFVYNNNPDDLDPLLKNPPEPWKKSGKTIKAVDARAVLLEKESNEK